MNYRYSKDFVVNPKEAFGNHQLYQIIYPRELLSEIGEILKIKSEDYELLNFSILNAAMNYEVLKNNIEHIQKPFHEEQAALKDLAKKAKALKNSYTNANQTGTAIFGMLIKCEGQSFLESKNPRSIAMLNQIFNNGSHYINALPDFLSIIEEMALYAAPKLKENSKKTNSSQRYLNWILNLSEILHRSPLNFTQGESASSERKSKYGSPMMSALIKIMNPLDPDTTESQIATAIKEYRKQYMPK